MWGALSDDVSFTIAADPRQNSHSRARVLSQIWDPPNLEGQVPV
jgi:hypothetical protein